LKSDSTLFVRVYGACHRDHTIFDNKRYQDSKLDISRDKYFGQEIKNQRSCLKNSNWRIRIESILFILFFGSHEQLAFPARFRLFPNICSTDSVLHSASKPHPPRQWSLAFRAPASSSQKDWAPNWSTTASLRSWIRYLFDPTEI